MHPTIIEIDTQQFKTNLLAIRKHIGAQVKFMLPVKANAYGHGLVGIAKLAEPFVDYFAISCFDEGLTLRNVGIIKPILIFAAIDEKQITDLIINNIEITVASLYKAKRVAEICALLGNSCRIHLKVDTGMCRVGVRPESLMELVKYVFEHPLLELIGLYSHLASSDDLENPITQIQIDKFKTLVGQIKKLKPSVICHLANSAGLCFFPDSYFDMVRPGILSYGYFPQACTDSDSSNKIKPCFTLKSRVCYFKVVGENTGISYNQRYITNASTRVVTLPIGYGDGYRRGLSNLGEVLLHGKRYQISGNVCMDMLMIDIGPDGEAYLGDEAILIGQQGDQIITVNSVADKLNTIIYEVLVSFTERIPRVLI